MIDNVAVSHSLSKSMAPTKALYTFLFQWLLTTMPWDRYYYYSHFLDKETEEQGSHPYSKWQSLNLNPNLSGPCRSFLLWKACPFLFTLLVWPVSCLTPPPLIELLVSRHPAYYLPVCPRRPTKREGVCSFTVCWMNKQLSKSDC